MRRLAIAARDDRDDGEPTPIDRRAPSPTAPRLLLSLLLLLLLGSPMPARGYAEDLTPTAERDGVSPCSGMYGPADLSGGGDSWIEVQIQHTTGNLSISVFDFEDRDNIAKEAPPELFQRPVLREKVDALTATFPVRVRYFVTATGYYCLSVYPTTPRVETFAVVVERRNPYGELPANEYPNLLFYAAVSIIYLSLGVLWMVKCSFYWRDILPVQHYISGVILVLMVEMSFNYGYWSDYNSSGQKSSALLALIVLLNAARTSISLFVLLIVALGYGVVKPTLGSTMRKCLALTYTHFIFNVLYSAGAMATQPETAGIYALFFVLPLSVTMTIFYTWTLRALKATTNHLEARKQAVKRLMYQRLWGLLAFSLVLVLLFFVVNSVHFAHREEVEWASKTWKYKWFLVDGWMNVLYLVVFVTICYLWRPTANNLRYGLEELSTSDDSDDAAERGVYTTGTEGHRVKLREQRPASTAAASDATINETAAGYGVSETGPDAAGGAEGGGGINSNDSIFDIGDEVDDWLDDHDVGHVDSHDHRDAGPRQSRSSRSRSRSPRRSREVEERLTGRDSKSRAPSI